jgi:hypothetical protein
MEVGISQPGIRTKLRKGVPGKESVHISDPNSENYKKNVRVVKANPESIMEVCKPVSVISQTDDRESETEACMRMNDNPKFRMSESEATLSMDASPQLQSD